MTNPIKLPFPEAIAFFRRKLNVPTADWKTIQEAENDWAFGVAGVTNAEMLADFRAACDRYIADGASFVQFAKDYEAIATRYGWKPKQGIAYRAQVAASTNMRQAYAAGQWQQRQNPAVRRLRPGLKWRHRDSVDYRPHHKMMDGKVFEASKVAWSLPCGFGCKCRWLSVPKPDGGYFELSNRLPYELPDGKQVKIPAVRVGKALFPVADPGFFHQAGASPVSDRPSLLQRMINRQPEPLRKAIALMLKKFQIATED